MPPSFDLTSGLPSLSRQLTPTASHQLPSSPSHPAPACTTTPAPVPRATGPTHDPPRMGPPSAPSASVGSRLAPSPRVGPSLAPAPRVRLSQAPSPRVNPVPTRVPPAMQATPSHVRHHPPSSTAHASSPRVSSQLSHGIPSTNLYGDFVDVIEEEQPPQHHTLSQTARYSAHLVQYIPMDNAVINPKTRANMEYTGPHLW
jgi:hypothetical protein